MAVQAEKKDIKLIVIDIDGTLLNSKMELSERNEKAIKAAAAKGVQIAFATGKSYNAAKHLFEKLELKAPGIFVQGLITYDASGSITHQQVLSTAVCRKVITFAEERGFYLLAYSGARVMTRAVNQRIYDEMAKYHEILEPAGSLYNIIGDVPINKIVAIGEDGRATKALRWQLNTMLDSSARVVQAGIAHMLEIVPAGASKGSALKMLTKDLRIPADQVMAIGDAENDIEMIQFAGLGVAMGQADDAVKSHAKYVAPSHDEDGVADAIEKFILPPPEPVAEVTAKAESPDASKAPETKPNTDGAGEKSS